MRKISIIVPVYNSDSSVGRTLDSLLTQTYRDIEVICVDDGSTDDSALVLEAYSLHDERVKVVRQLNQGVSVARNTGLGHVSASSDIVMFVDADDTLVEHACERVAAIFDEHEPDILTFGLTCDPPEAAPASLRRELAPANRIYEPFAPELLFKEHSRPYACRSALSCEFAEREGVRFEPGVKLGEDQIFYFETYPFACKTVLSSEKLYVYKMNDASATHRERVLEDKLDQHLAVIEAIVRIWGEKGFRDERCLRELLEWSLDFLMLDIGKLPVEGQRRMWARLLAATDGFLGESERYAVRFPTRRCLRGIRLLANGRRESGIGKLDVGLFYLMRRGFVRCIERVLMKLRLVS